MACLTRDLAYKLLYGTEAHLKERHCDATQRRSLQHALRSVIEADDGRIPWHLAARVDAAPDLERMAEVPLNITAFRFNPGGLDDQALDDLNARLGEAVLADGRFLVGTSKLGRRTIFRPAFSNWRTREADVDEFVTVVRELGASLASQRA